MVTIRKESRREHNVSRPPGAIVLASIHGCVDDYTASKLIAAVDRAANRTNITSWAAGSYDSLRRDANFAAAESSKHLFADANC
jgi:hypothetical protein